MKSGFYQKGGPVNSWAKKNVIMPCAAFMSAAAVASIGLVWATQQHEAADTPHEVVEVDPWTQCIKNAADEALRKGDDFEKSAQACSKLAPALRHPA